MVDGETFGQRVRRTRGTRMISLRELAARVGCSPATLSQVECDLRSPGDDVELHLRRWLDHGDPGPHAG